MFPYHLSGFYFASVSCPARRYALRLRVPELVLARFALLEHPMHMRVIVEPSGVGVRHRNRAGYALGMLVVLRELMQILK